jgi:Immunity protein 27
MSVAMKLLPTETEPIGKWEMVDGRVRGDGTCERIEWLTSRSLEKIAASGGGWEILFRDPEDGRYWERTYLHGEMHGGGPPSLVALSAEKAHAKYGFTERTSSNNP